MSRLTLVAAARHLGISPAAMASLAERADISVHAEGGRHWFDVGELDQLPGRFPEVLARLRSKRTLRDEDLAVLANGDEFGDDDEVDADHDMELEE